MDVSKCSPRKSLKRHHVSSSQISISTKQQVHQQLQVILGQKVNAVKSIRDMLSGSYDSDSADIKKDIYLFAIKQLNKELFTPSEAKELIGVLIAEINDLDGSVLVEIVEFFVEGIKKGWITNGVSLELFPYVLENIGKRQSVAMGGDPPTKMNGLDCKSHLINSLFGCRWSPLCVSPVVNMCRDINLLPDELQFLVEKLLRVMVSLPYDELPPLVHQLLVMSCKGHTVLILEGILDLFNRFDKEEIREGSQETEGLVEVGRSRDALYTVEGTALLHFNQAVMQNKALRTEFFKGLKTAQPHVDSLYTSPFSLALSLSLTKMSILSETVFDHLKWIVIKSFKHKDHIRSSCWARELSDEDSVTEIKDVFVHVVEQSMFGWDPVLQGLFNFAFELMDSFAPKTSSAHLQTTPQSRACTLGGTILVKCVKYHTVVRLEVLNQLINRILGNATTSCVDHYVCVVAEVARSVPQVILEGAAQLKDLLSFLNSIPSVSSVKLMQAILPLVQYKVTVRDSLIMVLRKLLFSKQLDCRLSAVGGYLLLLKHFKVLGSFGTSQSCGTSSSSQFSYSSQSQTLVEVHMSSDPCSVTGNESLCLEILGVLRRCFSQQDKVKLTLYEGLYDVICSNTNLAGPVLEILLNQFNKYYEEDTDLTPPVKLDQCSSSSPDHDYCRREPLAHLLCCIQRCVRKLLELGDSSPPIMDTACTVLMSLSQRLVRTELSDFVLDRASDYSSTSTVGMKNSINASIVMGLYETLMDYVFTSGQFSQESCDLTLKLYSGYQNIQDLLVEKGVGGAGRRGSSSSPGGRFSCLLPMASVVFILKAVFSDVIPAHQVSLAKLRETLSFGRYIINTTLLKIQQIGDQASPWEWGSRSVSSLIQRNFESGCAIGRILLEQIDQLASREVSKKEKGKSVHVLCLEGFGQLCHVMVTCYPNQTDQFLTSLKEGQASEAADTSSDQDKTLHFIKHFQRLAVSVLSASAKSYSMKEVVCMLNIMKVLSDRLTPESTQIKQVFDWNLAQCKEQNIEDVNVVKNLVGFTLSLDYSIRGNLKMIRKFAQDIHYHVGDIDDDVQFTGSSNFAVVTPRTATSSVFTPLSDQIDHYLDDAILTLKTISLNETSADSSSQSEVFVSRLCERMVQLVTAFQELVQTALPVGPPNEVLIKSLTKLYGVLTDTAKYQLGLYSNVSVILPQFRKLIDNVGQCLSQNIYNFILYVQETQGEQNPRGRGSKKGKAPPTSGKTQVKKEARSIPNLIYVMEQLENLLIRISKKSKENIMDTFKRSVARDFRIRDDQLNAILNEQEEEEDDIEDEKDGKENEGAPPAKKKRKKN